MSDQKSNNGSDSDQEMNQNLIKKDSEDKDKKEFKESPYRFVQLAIFFFQHLVLEISVSGVTSIGSQLSDVFDINLEVIVFSSTLLNIATMLATLFNAYYLEKIGLRNDNMLFAFLSLAGCILKFFTFKSVLFLMFAQFITGVSNAFILNGQMFFFQNWFSPKNIKYYFPLVATAVFIGIGTGAILPFIFIDQNEDDKEKFTQQFKNFMYFYIGINGLNVLLSTIFFKEKTPALEGEKSENQDYDWKTFKKELKGLLTDKKFLHFCAIIAFGRGVLLMVFGNFNIYFTELNFSQLESSFVLEMFILFGLIGSALYNWKLSDNQHPRTTLIIFTICLSLMFYYLNIIEAMKWMFSLSGFFLVNKIPMIFTLCMQNTDTSNVSLINICLFMVSQLFSVILNTILGHFANTTDNGGIIFFFTVIGIYLFTFLLILLLSSKDQLF